ncbi:hypothetical protein NUACC21_82190 [Scytonema sp. NUACC21]
MQELQTEQLQPIKLLQLPEKPLFSILIANYNYAKYIGETLICHLAPLVTVIAPVPEVLSKYRKHSAV